MSLYLYDLPKDLLDTLTVRGGPPEEPQREPTPEPARPAQTSLASGRSCGVCQGAVFVDLDDQRAHFRSDWHRYNVKARLANGKTVNEQEFAALVDSLDQSISGSESSSDDDDGAGSKSGDAVRDLLARGSHDPALRPDSPQDLTRPRSSVTWFHSPPSTQIGVYNAVFPANTPATSYVDALKDMQHGGEEGRIWTLLMTAGGHFAGVVVRVCPADDAVETKASKHRKGKQHAEVLRHKTFHRYTTRRKQGGSQSVNDNAKGPAKSAGAQLRRYGEQALRDDIRGLLEDWKDDIEKSELIWIRASVSNRRIFFDYDEAPVDKRDERLRTFPFPTRRPTQAELTRCINELTYVKTSHLTEDALLAREEAFLASLPKPKPTPTPQPVQPKPAEKPAAPKISKEEEALREKWRRALEMVQKGRLEPLVAFWAREGAALGGPDVRIPAWAGERDATLLQAAARAAQADVVRWLLEDAQADPTIPLPDSDPVEADEEDGYASDAPLPQSGGVRRTAYDVAASKTVRNVFRRAAWAHPERWDWLGAGRVPSALSPEMEEGRDDKKKARRKGLKDKMREREKTRPASPSPEPAPPPRKETPKEPTSGPRKLGGASGAQDGVAGLSAEMRARVERERRARAAEARLKALGQG
ncbi:hypothetical protein AURDEDRAFT_86423 [Auricularia subglabra TFB-10046 SS5]|nr:hypothetical protein AURDEDRAFT_86423 [Auricularia subglabra TFB-10046 SS5]